MLTVRSADSCMCQAQMFTRVPGTFGADVGGCLCGPPRQNHTSLSVINLTHTDMCSHAPTRERTHACLDTCFRMDGHQPTHLHSKADPFTYYYTLMLVQFIIREGGVDKRITQCSCPLIFKGAVHPAYKSSCTVMVKVVKGQHVFFVRRGADFFAETVSQNINTCCRKDFRFGPNVVNKEFWKPALFSGLQLVSFSRMEISLGTA